MSLGVVHHALDDVLTWQSTKKYKTVVGVMKKLQHLWGEMKDMNGEIFKDYGFFFLFHLEVSYNQKHAACYVTEKPQGAKVSSVLKTLL